MTPLRIAAACALFAAGPALADDHRTPSPDGAIIYIVSPQDGATVSNPVTIVFGARGIGIAPAGVERDNTGHHHLMINVEVDEELLSQSLPADDNHIHFGGGQTETTRELPAGTHTLQLVMGDHNHVPHIPPVLSEPVTITVTE
jgi:hypothetical protein